MVVGLDFGLVWVYTCLVFLIGCGGWLLGCLGYCYSCWLVCLLIVLHLLSYCVT